MIEKNKLASELAINSYDQNTNDVPCLALTDLCDALKVRHYALMALPRGEQSFNDVMIYSNWAPAILEEAKHFYPAKQTSLTDKVASKIIPFFWEHHVGNAENEKTSHHLIEEILCDAKLLDGLVVPIHAPKGHVYCALFSFSKRKPSLTEIAVLSATSRELINHYVENRNSKDDLSDQLLSKRERQCLVWIATGKTSYEISVTLGLSEHTVNTIISNVCDKLGAVTTNHAVAKAMKQGLVDTDI